MAKALPARELEAARRYLEYLRDFGDAEPEGPAEVELAWAAELKQRIDGLEEDPSRGEPWSKVRARLKRGRNA